jgi:ADP-ribose pyrophosphatase
MTTAPKTKILSRTVEFEGWHKLETLVVQHASLRHEGTAFEPITREIFICGTCAIVLLYQPETDEVLLNEQFRIGAFIAGEPNPWLYECCAGMIEEGEQPEEAVRREAVEETGCQILDLEFIGKAYPSPGGTDEKYMMYCGRIGKAVTGHFGADEDEEIRTHLIPATEAIRLLDEGKILNSGTIMCLQWFARNHDRLRNKWSQK